MNSRERAPVDPPVACELQKPDVKEDLTMETKLRLAIIAGALLLMNAAPAVASADTISIDPYGAAIDNGASKVQGSFAFGGIALPDSGVPDFGFGFVIPDSYKKETPIRISLYWHTQLTSCDFRLEPNFVDRTRPGHAASTGDASGGLAPEDGSEILTAPATAGQGNVKIYVLKSDQGFVQQPGDAILLGLFRNADNPSDTCAGDLLISGILVDFGK
jgi:hypothetical protein